MPFLLRKDYINSLPQPFMAKFCGGDEWPVIDMCVETGMLRIDVIGLCQVTHIGEVLHFIDAEGGVHNSDTFYTDYAD